MNRLCFNNSKLLIPKNKIKNSKEEYGSVTNYLEVDNSYRNEKLYYTS